MLDDCGMDGLDRVACINRAPIARLQQALDARYGVQKVALERLRHCEHARACRVFCAAHDCTHLRGLQKGCIVNVHGGAEWLGRGWRHRSVSSEFSFVQPFSSVHDRVDCGALRRRLACLLLCGHVIAHGGTKCGVDRVWCVKFLRANVARMSVPCSAPPADYTLQAVRSNDCVAAQAQR